VSNIERAPKLWAIQFSTGWQYTPSEEAAKDADRQGLPVVEYIGAATPVAEDYINQSSWVIGGCYEDNRLRLIKGRVLDAYEDLVVVDPLAFIEWLQNQSHVPPNAQLLAVQAMREFVKAAE
jgi:hypothetical protein